MLTIICALVAIICILTLTILYYEVYKPTWQHRKADTGRYATAEEIDALLYEADPFDATEFARHADR